MHLEALNDLTQAQVDRVAVRDVGARDERALAAAAVGITT